MQGTICSSVQNCTEDTLNKEELVSRRLLHMSPYTSLHLSVTVSYGNHMHGILNLLIGKEERATLPYKDPCDMNHNVHYLLLQV